MFNPLTKRTAFASVVKTKAGQDDAVELVVELEGAVPDALLMTPEEAEELGKKLLKAADASWTFA